MKNDKKLTDKANTICLYRILEKYSDEEHLLSMHDIIGHFDLITKFIEQDPHFDVNHPRYVKAWQDAADILLKTGKPFEVNTGAISRGYRTDPYPSAEIRRYIRDHGGMLILSSDAHQKENIGFQFAHYENEILC